MRKVCTIVLLLSLGFVVLTNQTTTNDLSQYKSDTIEVEVKGEVHNPGVYKLDWHATTKDAIELAGGINEVATLDAINLSEPLNNHAVIIIPKKPEKTCISINRASLEELDTLSGVGPAIAQRIIEYRLRIPFKI